MTEQVLFLTETFEPFTSEWGAVCIPLQYEDAERLGYILPIGWEEELNKRSITFTEVEVTEE